MRVLINALSATNLSSRHVLLGHLAQLAKWTRGEHSFVVLYHKANQDIRRDLGDNVEWFRCPDYTAHWVGRALWERFVLPKLAKDKKTDFIFLPTGLTIPHLHIPQISFAQNPWFLMPHLQKNPYHALKCAIQRVQCSQAMKQASMMLFLSEFMRQAYRKKTGLEEKKSEVVYPGIDDDVHATAEKERMSISKNPFQILCVSVMASHKGIETIVEALYKLLQSYRVPAELYLVGPWSDLFYEQKIKKLVGELQLRQKVFTTGHVSRDELHRYYAKSKVFCLMSHCESFGIPAVEAQAFGTPVVSSNCCAIPEVCGKGGVYPELGDVSGTAEALGKMLTDQVYWEQMSRNAVENASKYRWEICSRPLLKMFDAV